MFRRNQRWRLEGFFCQAFASAKQLPFLGDSSALPCAASKPAFGKVYCAFTLNSLHYLFGSHVEFLKESSLNRHKRVVIELVSFYTEQKIIQLIIFFRI